MSLLTKEGLFADHSTTGNVHVTKHECDRESKMDVTNHEADKKNDADKPDNGATSSEESTHSREHKAQRVNHRK